MRSLCRLLLCVALATPLSACDPGPSLPEIRQLRVRRLSAGFSARPWPVELLGTGLRSSARHPLRLEIVRRSPAFPRVRAALQNVRRSGELVRAEVPAGLPPGEYRLAVFRGVRGSLTQHQLRIQKPPGNLGYPVLEAVWSQRARAGEGGTLVVTGSNVQEPVLVTLHGPHRRFEGSEAAQPVTLQGAARMSGKKVTIPFEVRYRKLAITELANVTAATPTRILARLPRTLGPGRYYVQAYTATHRGNKPEVTFQVGERLGSGRVAWSVGWIVFLFLGVLGSTLLFGRPLARDRRRIAVLLLVVALCVSPLFLIL
ncbi:MAG: hypothetical protein ABI333_05205 [bacterium]